MAKDYVIDGHGRRLVPVSLDDLVDGSKDVDLKPYAKKTEVKKDINKATDDLEVEISKEYIDNEDLEAALADYVKESDVEGVVQEKVDAAIEDLDIEKYIDEEEIAEKIEELALDSYAKKADVEALESDYNTFKEGITEGMETVAESLESHAAQLQEIEDALKDDYATKVELGEVSDAVGNLEDTVDTLDTDLTALREEFDAEVQGVASEFESLTSRLDEFTPDEEGTEGTLEKWAGDKDAQIYSLNEMATDASINISGLGERVDALEEKSLPEGETDHDIMVWDAEEQQWVVSDEFVSAQDNISTIDARVDELDTSTLKKSEAYDIERKIWFEGDATKVSTSKYRIIPEFKLEDGACIGTLSGDKIVSIGLYHDAMVQNVEIYYEGDFHSVTLREDEIGGNYCYEFDAVEISSYPDTLALRPIYALVDAEGTAVTASEEFYAAVASLVGGVLIDHDEKIRDAYEKSNRIWDNNLVGSAIGGRLETIESKLPEEGDEYLKKSESYDVVVKQLFSTTATLIADDRYELTPLIEPLPGMIIKGFGFGEIARINDDRSIDECPIYYEGAERWEPVFYDSENDKYWFNAKNASEFPQELEIGAIMTYVAPDDSLNMATDKFFGVLAYLIADPILELQKAVQELSSGMGQWITALNSEIQGVKERVAALERKVLVKYFLRVEGNGTDDEFILYAGDETQDIVIQHIFINGVLDNDSTLTYHDGYTHVQIRQENPRYSGNYEPVVLEQGDIVTVEFYKWSN